MRRPSRTFAPVPRRIPALQWRRPFAVWTPAALVLALGWPALMLAGQDSLFEIAMIAGGAGAALAMVSLGAAWALRRPPRARRNVIRHMVWSGAAIAGVTPFVLTPAVNSAAFGMAPLAMMLSLPIALFSGIVFSLVALVKPKRVTPHSAAHAVSRETPERVRDLERL